MRRVKLPGCIHDRLEGFFHRLKPETVASATAATEQDTVCTSPLGIQCSHPSISASGWQYDHACGLAPFAGSCQVPQGLALEYVQLVTRVLIPARAPTRRGFPPIARANQPIRNEDAGQINNVGKGVLQPMDLAMVSRCSRTSSRTLPVVASTARPSPSRRASLWIWSGVQLARRERSVKTVP